MAQGKVDQTFRQNGELIEYSEILNEEGSFIIPTFMLKLDTYPSIKSYWIEKGLTNRCTQVMDNYEALRKVGLIIPSFVYFTVKPYKMTKYHVENDVPVVLGFDSSIPSVILPTIGEVQAMCSSRQRLEYEEIAEEGQKKLERGEERTEQEKAAMLMLWMNKFEAPEMTDEAWSVVLPWIRRMFTAKESRSSGMKQKLAYYASRGAR